MLRLACALCAFAIVFAPGGASSQSDVDDLTAAVLAPVVEHAHPPPAVPEATGVLVVLLTAVAILAAAVRCTFLGDALDACWRRLRDPVARATGRRGPPLLTSA